MQVPEKRCHSVHTLGLSKGPLNSTDSQAQYLGFPIKTQFPCERLHTKVFTGIGDILHPTMSCHHVASWYRGLESTCITAFNVNQAGGIQRSPPSLGTLV